MCRVMCFVCSSGLCGNGHHHCKQLLVAHSRDIDKNLRWVDTKFCSILECLSKQWSIIFLYL